jgi:hypothetical protein
MPARTGVGAAAPAPDASVGRWDLDPWQPVPAEIQAALQLRASDPTGAVELLHAAQAQALDAGDARLMAFALHREADLSVDLEDLNPDRLYLRALALHELRGDLPMVGVAANDLGLVLRSRYDDGTEWFRYAVKVKRAAGDWKGLRTSLSNLGGALLLRGDPVGAIAALDEARPLAEHLGDREAGYKIELNLAGGYEQLALRSDGGVDAAAFEQAMRHFWRAADHGASVGRPASDVCDALPQPTSLCDDQGPILERAPDGGWLDVRPSAR